MTYLLAYSLQTCSTLHNPMDCSLPGSSVLGILQSRILDWVTMPSPLVLPDPGIEPLFPADSVLKIKDITFHMERYHFPYSQSYGFSSSHVQILEFDHKED